MNKKISFFTPLALFVLGPSVCAEVVQSANASDSSAVKKASEETADSGENEAGGPTLSSSATPKSPSYQNVRFEEDWSDLREATSRDGWNALKYIPLGEGGSAYMSLGGQLRQRSEFWNDFGFGGSGNRDDTFGLLRLRLHSDIFVGPHFRFFAEAKSSLAHGRVLPGGNRALDTDSLALQNVFLDFRTPLTDDGSLTFRVGRQELQFGKQRLVSPLDWINTRPRSFDGFRGIFKRGSWQVNGFWGSHVRVRKYDFNPHDTGTDFFGVYAIGQFGRTGVSIDLYWLGLERDKSSFGAFSAAESRHTVGSRLAGKFSTGLDFDFETAYQWGDHGTRNISAAMLASQLGYSFATRTSPRFYLGFDYASGDDDPRDGRVSTFNQLFPLGHAYLGFIDVVGRQNITDFSQGFSFNPLARLSVKIDHHLFWRSNDNDALYNAGGGVVRAGSLGDSKRVGSELDFTCSYKVNRHLVTALGYSHFFAADFIRESGSSQHTDFAYISIQYTW